MLDGGLHLMRDRSTTPAEHYRAFIDLWKNADPELQPRVAAAPQRVRKLTPVERVAR